MRRPSSARQPRPRLTLANIAVRPVAPRRCPTRHSPAVPKGHAARLARSTARLAARRTGVRRSTYRIDAIAWTSSAPSRPVAGWNLQGGLHALGPLLGSQLHRNRAAQCVDRIKQVLRFFQNEPDIEVSPDAESLPFHPLVLTLVVCGGGHS